MNEHSEYDVRYVENMARHTRMGCALTFTLQ